ncbi:MAG: ABC transporter ATP-binding protein [Spirochaetales bacterium]|nr:ABC transporter ATP-binding protein [Spirochaetales bacterium]
MITIDNLTFRYGKKPLFDNLNLSLKEGNIYGLLGMNGAGKTTLLKVLSGQLFRKEGDADVLGFDPGIRHPEMLREIFYLPEEFFLPRTSVEVYLKLYSPFYERFNKEEFEGYCEIFQLDLTQKLSDYSFGQKKKFLLAFGLASGTKLLILDEPTNGLDIPSKSQFRKTVASAITPERSFLISTHQVRDMENLIDPIVILHQGKVILNNTLEEVSSRIRMEKTLGEPAPSESILYSEKVPGGYYSIRKAASPSEESALDLEVLFNGVVTDPMGIGALIGEERA